MRLDGRTALVTGAARGIGRATATTLAEWGAGVAVADVRSEVVETAGMIREQGVRSAAAQFDVSDADAVTAGVQELRAALGEIDVLVSNAGIVDHIAPLSRMEPTRWEHEIAVNLTGAFNVIRAVIGPMAEQGWGRIIVISSGAARGGLHHQAAYAASKAGLIGLVQTVTLEHARHGITCNAVLPGLIETENVQRMPEEIRTAFRGTHPSRRFGTMTEVAALIAFLASEEAGYINGAEIDIDGGMRLNTGSLGSRRETRAQQMSHREVSERRSSDE